MHQLGSRYQRPFFFDFGVVTHKGASNKLVNLSRDSGQSRTGGLGTGDWDWGLSTLSTSVRAVPEEGPPGVELKGAEQPASPLALAFLPTTGGNRLALAVLVV